MGHAAQISNATNFITQDQRLATPTAIHKAQSSPTTYGGLLEGVGPAPSDISLAYCCLTPLTRRLIALLRRNR